MSVEAMKQRLEEIRTQKLALEEEANEISYTLMNMQQATNPEDMHTCRDRMDQPGPWKHEEMLDRWVRVGNDRCCSFCGSMHPDDLSAALDLETTKIDVSDKRYKVYVRRPGVINASAGAIKFYNWHLPSEVDAATNLLERINTRAALTLQKLKQAR